MEKISNQKSLNYLLFETVQMGYSGAWRKLVHEKNLKSKISWRCPFKLPFACTKLYILEVADSRCHSLPTGNYIPWLWIYSSPPPPTHTQKWKQNCVCDVSICKSGGGDFIRNAAKMFSFDPIPTRTKKAWSSSTCLLYASTSDICVVGRQSDSRSSADRRSVNTGRVKQGRLRFAILIFTCEHWIAW